MKLKTKKILAKEISGVTLFEWIINLTSVIVMFLIIGVVTNNWNLVVFGILCFILGIFLVKFFAFYFKFIEKIKKKLKEENEA